MKTVKVKNVILGEGAPKICVPMVGKNETEILAEAKNILSVDFDIVEWRVDFFEFVEDFSVVIETGTKIRKILQNAPILLTFRTKKEGGVHEMEDAKYFGLYRELIASGLVDLVDVELFMDSEEVQHIVDFAHENGVKVVMCNHDFDKTPPQAEIVARLKMMQEKHADICKIAVMPQTRSDVLTLLSATEEMYTHFADRPLITMSMGGLGMVSRVSGEIFGSAMTFGAATKASAPGQVPVDQLRTTLDLFHNNL